MSESRGHPAWAGRQVDGVRGPCAGDRAVVSPGGAGGQAGRASVSPRWTEELPQT